MNPIAPLLVVLGLAHASPQSQPYGIQVLNPHNMTATVQVSALQSHPDLTNTEIAWLEDDPKVGLGINWRNFSDNINLGGLDAAYGLIGLPCSGLDSGDTVHVQVSYHYVLTCSGYEAMHEQCWKDGEAVHSEFCDTCDVGCPMETALDTTWTSEIIFYRGLGGKKHNCGDAPYLEDDDFPVKNVTHDWLTLEVDDFVTDIMADCPTYCQVQCTDKQVGTPTFGLSTRVFV